MFNWFNWLKRGNKGRVAHENPRALSVVDASEAVSLRAKGFDEVLARVEQATRVLGSPVENPLGNTLSREAVSLASEISEITQSIQRRVDEAHEEQQALTTVLDVLHDGIITVTGDNYTILNANPASQAMLKANEEQLVGMSLASFIPRPVLDDFSRRSIGSKLAELEVLDYQGESILCEISLSKYTRSGVSYVYAVLRDVTERHQRNKAIERRDLILSGLGKCSKVLFKATWKSQLQYTLETIGVASSADYAALYRLRDPSKFVGYPTSLVGVGVEAQSLMVERLAQWTERGHENMSGVAQWNVGGHATAKVLDCLRRQQHCLTQDPVLCAAIMTEPVKRLLTIPVMVNGDWWGIFVYAYQDDSDSHIDIEIEALKVVSGILGSAIEKDLRDDEIRSHAAFLDTLFDTLPNPVYAKSLDGSVFKANRAFLRDFGMSSEEVLGKSMSELLSVPEDAKADVEHDSYLMQTQGLQLYEGAIINTKSRQVKRGMWFKRLLFNANLKANGIIAAFVDLTDLYTMNDNLRFEKNLLSHLLDALEHPIAVKDDTGKLLVANTEYLKLFCLDQWYNPVKPLQGALAELAIKDITALGGSYESAAEERVCIEQKNYVVRRVPVNEGGAKRIVIVYTDVTTTVRAEQEIEKRTSMYSDLLALSPEAVLTHKDGKVVTANKAAIQMFNASDDRDLVGKELLGFFSSEDEQMLRSILQEGPKLMYRPVELTAQSRSRRGFPVEVRTSQAELGGTVYGQTVITDLTLRKQSDAILHRLRTALNASSDVIVIVDDVQRIMFHNTAFTEVYGYSADETVDKSISMLWQPKPFDDPEASRMLRGGAKWEGKVRTRTKWGEWKDDRFTVIPIMNGRPEPIFYLVIKFASKHRDENLTS